MENIKKQVIKADVIYVRVSSKEQVLGFSLDSQEKICRSFSERSSREVLRVFREEGESAKTANRTELKKMMIFCERNRKQIGRIVIYRVDRMARDTGDYHFLKVFFKRLGISIASATENLEDTPVGKLNETMLSAFAQFDNEVKSQRTLTGMRERLLKGLWSTSAPLGYINTTDEIGTKIIAPHPEKAQIIKMLFEKYITGKYTYKELAGLANKMGVTSRHGLKFNKQLVAKIIKNPIYHGMIVVPKLEICLRGRHQPIISDQLFKEAQDLRHGIVGRKLPRNRDNPEYPLRGVSCEGCGRNLTGGRSRSKTGKYYQYYSCINPNCPKRVAIKKDDLEKDFTEFLQKLTPNQDFFNGLKEAIKLAYKIEFQSITSLEQKLSIQIAEAKDEKDKLLNLRIKGSISDEDFIPANERYKIKLAELEAEKSSLSTPELGLENVIDSTIEFLKHLPENWKSLDVKDLRVLRTLLFPKNVVYAYPSIKTPELCPIYNLKSELDVEKNRLVRLEGIEPPSMP